MLGDRPCVHPLRSPYVIGGHFPCDKTLAEIPYLHVPPPLAKQIGGFPTASSNAELLRSTGAACKASLPNIYLVLAWTEMTSARQMDVYEVGHFAKA